MRRLVKVLVPGSFLAVNHSTSAVSGAAMEDAVAHRDQVGMPTMTPRSPEQIARFFDGLDLLEPGVVPCSRWRPTSARCAASHPRSTNSAAPPANRNGHGPVGLIASGPVPSQRRLAVAMEAPGRHWRRRSPSADNGWGGRRLAMGEALTIRVRRERGYVVVSVAGEVDIATVARLRDRLSVPCWWPPAVRWWSSGPGEFHRRGRARGAGRRVRPRRRAPAPACTWSAPSRGPCGCSG